MDKQEIIEKLRDDENYYGEYGRQYLSNSDIRALLNNPLAYPFFSFCKIESSIK